MPIHVCGAWSSGPGRNTNMKPPLRASSHCTSRTLDTRASTIRPTDVEAHRVADVDLEALVDALLDRHFGGASRSPRGSASSDRQNAPSIDLLVRLEVIAIGDRELARERALAADVLEGLEVGVAPAHAGHARAHDRDQPRRAGAGALRASRNARTAVHLRRQDLDQEHVGAARPSSSENCCSRLACSERTPITKKLPMPTASRITRVWLPGRPRLSTAWRSGNQRARATGRTRADDAGAARCSTNATPANPPQTISPTRSEAACHAGDGDERRADQHRGADLHPVDVREPRAHPRGRPPRGIAGRPGRPSCRRGAAAAA